MKKAFNWLAVIGSVAGCAVCWLFLLIVSPFIPDIDKRAGCRQASRDYERGF